MKLTTTSRPTECRRSEVIELGQDWSVTVNYGWVYWTGQDRPRFSLTVRYHQGGSRRFGAYFQAVRDHFPHLADLIPWNLCDADGVPTNYVAGADYWYGLTAGRGQYTDMAMPDGCLTFADALAAHLRCGPAGDRAEMDAILDTRRFREAAGNGDRGRELFLDWMEARRPRLRDAMRETMHKHGIEEVAVESCAGPPYV